MDDYPDFEHRVMERTGFCRSCDKKIKAKTEKVIYTSTWRNGGQEIYICESCIIKMYWTINDNDG